MEFGAWKLQISLLGEIESYSTTERLNMNDAERKVGHPYSSQKEFISKDVLIIGGNTNSYLYSKKDMGRIAKFVEKKIKKEVSASMTI